MSLITVTQPIGCDGLQIAAKVAEQLSIELYDDSKLREEAARMGLQSWQLEGFLEKSPGFFDRIWSEKPQMALDLMETVVYRVSQRGEGVIVEHGSQLLLRDFSCAMRVLILADEETRIHNLVRELGMSREAIRKLMRESDHQKRGFFRYAFQKDWDDPALYDLCLNPGKIGIEKAVRIIVEMAQYAELKACSDHAVEVMERLAHARQVKAALRELGIRQLGLRIDVPEKGVVQISGALYDPEDEQRIPDRVKTIAGVERIRMDVVLIPAGGD